MSRDYIRIDTRWSWVRRPWDQAEEEEVAGTGSEASSQLVPLESCMFVATADAKNARQCTIEFGSSFPNLLGSGGSPPRYPCSWRFLSLVVAGYAARQHPP